MMINRAVDLSKGVSFLSLVCTMIIGTHLVTSYVYTHTYSVASISINLENHEDQLFARTLEGFLEKESLVLSDKTVNLPNVKRILLYELLSENEELVMKVSGLGDRKRFTISFYENKHKDWKVLYDLFYHCISEKLPNAILKKKLRSEL